MTCVIVLQDAIPPPCNILYIFMVKQPVKPFLLIDNPRTLPVTQLNVPVANLLKFILGSKAERYKANSFLLFYSPQLRNQVSSKRHPAPTSIAMTNIRTHLLIPDYCQYLSSHNIKLNIACCKISCCEYCIQILDQDKIDSNTQNINRLTLFSISI